MMLNHAALVPGFLPSLFKGFLTTSSLSRHKSLRMMRAHLGPKSHSAQYLSGQKYLFTMRPQTDLQFLSPARIGL